MAKNLPTNKPASPNNKFTPNKYYPGEIMAKEQEKGLVVYESRGEGRGAPDFRLHSGRDHDAGDEGVMDGIPKGLCQCGCGGLAPIALKNDKSKGMVKGQPMKFIRWHHLKNRYGEKHPQWKGGRVNEGHGYIFVMIPEHPRANKDGYVREHIPMAEKALGRPLPLKAVIHHHTPEQLVICQDQAYHMLLHQRQRALKACGHASWRKCWICKKYDPPEKLMIRGDAIYHRSCNSERCKSKYQLRKGAQQHG